MPEQGWKQVPYLDVATTTNDRKLFIHLVNVHPTEGMDVHLRINGGDIKSNGVLWRVAPADFAAQNDFGVKNISIEQIQSNSLSSDMIQHLEPHSITIIEAELQ